MKQKRIGIFITVVILIIVNQLYTVSIGSDINPIMFLNIGPNKGIDVKEFVLWFASYAVISFYFFGFFKKNLKEYGYIEIVKSNNKMKWLNKRIFLAIVIILIYIISSQVSNLIMNFKYIETLDIKEYILSVVLYFITMVTLIKIQGIFELCMNEEQSLIISMSFVVFSTMIGGLLYELKELPMVLYLLIPNNGMSFRNNILQPIEYGINPIIAIIVLLISNVLLYCIFRVVIKKEDII